MKLELERKWPKATYTIGRLYVDGVFFCNTLEDRDRGLNQSDDLNYIKSRKVYGETAVPKGEYLVDMNVTSPKYAAVSWYHQLCLGKMPRLRDVPGFDGILIHPGRTSPASRESSYIPAEATALWTRWAASSSVGTPRWES